MTLSIVEKGLQHGVGPGTTREESSRPTRRPLVDRIPSLKARTALHTRELSVLSDIEKAPWRQGSASRARNDQRMGGFRHHFDTAVSAMGDRSVPPRI